MSKLIKLSNFFIFSFALLLLFLTNNYSNISNSILAVLPDSKDKQILQAYSKYYDSKTLFVSFENLPKELISKVEQELQTIKEIKKESFYNNSLFEYKNKNQLLLNNLNEEKLKNIDIKKELQIIQDSLLNSFFPFIVNKYDPLNLFIKKEQNQQIKDIRVYKINKEINNLNSYKKLYKKIQLLEKRYPELKIFSTIFYFVENSQAIKEDVNKIIILAFLILLTLYLFILRNISLLLNTLTTLATSAIISTIVVTTLFSEVSIFVLVFGLSISTVAIDYMFHHYMHGYYVEKKRFNKEVFFGFFTTFIAFFIISFVSFPLIKQLAIFTIVSLLISYLHFSFLYPKIAFSFREKGFKKSFGFNINKFYILSFSTILIAISLFTITFDTNLRNLDYQNKKLDNLNTYFKEKLKHTTTIPVLIETTTIDDLMKKYKIIKKELPSLNSSLDLLISNSKFEEKKSLLENKEFRALKEKLIKESITLGFKKEYFQEAYTIEEKPSYSFEKLKELNINFFKYKNKYYLFINIETSSYEVIKEYEFIKALSMNLLFKDSLNKVKNEILILGVISLSLIVLLILFIAKKESLFALCFLLFPLAMILTYSFFTAFNILHLFMIFVILALSIDYAIYSSKNLDINTRKAILYSLLSTFAGFGVLVFSKINSLYSIGIVATIGVLAISFLLIFLKRSSNEN